GCVVRGRDRRQPRLDAMHTRLGQGLGDPHLVIPREDDAGLLLAVPQRDVVDLHRRGEMDGLQHLGEVVPGTREPLRGLPGLVCHPASPRLTRRGVASYTILSMESEAARAAAGRPESEARESKGEDGMLRHVAMFKWKEGVTDDQKTAARDALAALKQQVPSVVE